MFIALSSKATFGNKRSHPLSTFTFGQRSPGFTKCTGAQNRIKPSLFSHPPETAYLWGLYPVECFKQVSHDDQFIFSEQFGPIKMWEAQVVLQQVHFSNVLVVLFYHIISM